MTIYYSGFTKIGTGPTTITLEFNTKEKCENAANIIKKYRNDVDYNCIEIKI
jgi:hypothetical protein